MRIGLAKVDITPRVGVELCGFGPFLNRHSTSVRDRLWARAFAVEAGGTRAVLASCDLIGVSAEITARVRDLVSRAAGLPPEAVMVHCTHTHSGPSTGPLIGWGDPDPPYLEVLPGRIAEACIQALRSLREATLSHAEVQCEGLSYNREYDGRPPALEDALRDDWRPPHPELTDRSCHVFRIDAGGRTVGFFSHFSCHLVTCCESNHQIHGDFAGIAGGLLEKELGEGWRGLRHTTAPEPVVGLFLQGALGDVNTCVVHKGEDDSLRALDVLAERYARAVRKGLAEARPVPVDSIAFARRAVTFRRKPWGRDQLRELLAQQEAVLHSPGASDTSHEVRLAMVRTVAMRRMIAELDAGRSLEQPSELQAIRVGPVAFLGTPLEVFRAVKEEALARVPFPIPLLLGLTNDSLGYAVDRTVAVRGGYAADLVPLMAGSLPFADIHGQLVEELAALAGDLGSPKP